MRVPEDNPLSNKIGKEIDAHKGVFQSYLLGQLGKSDGVERGIGPVLIKYALDIFRQSFRSIGCRTVRLDCKHALVKFYEENGFRLVSQEKDCDECHMVALF